MAVAALNARPAAAQGFGYAAVAVSPSTPFSASAEKGTTSQASVESGALQICQQSGAKDCKVYGVTNACVAVATQASQVPPNLYGIGTGPTREGAAGGALAQCAKAGGIGCGVRVAPCSSDDVRFQSPLPLPPLEPTGPADPAIVGLWAQNVNSGIWVYQFSANGTYATHSEAPDNVPPQAGQFTASNGKFTVHAISVVWEDQGTYTFQGTTTMLLSGKLGTGTLYRIAADPVYGGQSSAPASGITIRR